MFEKATKSKSKLRLALVGPSGSGKTYTSLVIAKELAQCGPVGVIDTERGSASKYAGDVADFDTVMLDSFEPERYCKAIDAAAEGGYPVLVIDSLSHAWSGTGGALDQVDRRGGRWQAWREVTPMHNALVDAILGYPGHVISTMRSKTAYEVDRDDEGRTMVSKLGLAPVQRAGTEYEFDVVADMDLKHTMTVGKSRCPWLADQVIRKPGAEVAQRLLDWLEDGSERPADTALSLIAEGKVEEARDLASAHRAAMRKDEIQRLKAAFDAAKQTEEAVE